MSTTVDELDRASPLFEGTVPFRVILNDREPRLCELTLRFLEGTRVRPPGARAGGAFAISRGAHGLRRLVGTCERGTRAPTSLLHAHHPTPDAHFSQVSGSAPGRGARVLHVEVTDETDAFFLHSLTVGEAEYGELRADRECLVTKLSCRTPSVRVFTRPPPPPPPLPLSFLISLEALLVDFAAFPPHLLQLLRAAVLAKEETQPRCAPLSLAPPRERPFFPRARARRSPPTLRPSLLPGTIASLSLAKQAPAGRQPSPSSRRTRLSN